MRSPASDRTRDAILDSALEVIAREGLLATRMEDVAAAAGVSRQSVYYHFRSREELLSALLERGLDRLATEMRAAAETAPVDALAVVLLRFLAENDTLARLLVVEMWGVAGDPSEPRELVERIEAEVTQPVAARLSREVEAGRIVCEDERLTARAMVGQAAGMALTPIVTGDAVAGPETEQLLRRFTRTMLGLSREHGVDGDARDGGHGRDDVVAGESEAAPLRGDPR